MHNIMLSVVCTLAELFFAGYFVYCAGVLACVMGQEWKDEAAVPFVREVEGVLDQHIVGHTVFCAFTADQQLPCNCVVPCFDVLHASVHSTWVLHHNILADSECQAWWKHTNCNGVHGPTDA